MRRLLALEVALDRCTTNGNKWRPVSIATASKPEGCGLKVHIQLPAPCAHSLVVLKVTGGGLLMSQTKMKLLELPYTLVHTCKGGNRVQAKCRGAMHAIGRALSHAHRGFPHSSLPAPAACATVLRTAAPLVAVQADEPTAPAGVATHVND